MNKHQNVTEPLMTTKDVALAMKVSEKTVRRRISSGELPVIRDGRLIRIRPQDYRKYLMLRFDV